MTDHPRALVADDDVAIRVLVCRVLTRSGFEVDAVPDGAAAIENILARSYAVVVLDLMMPRLDGSKVIEYLQSTKPELLKRVIVMTAYGATGFEHVASLVGACIEKPFEVTSLVKSAKALLPPPAAAVAEPRLTTRGESAAPAETPSASADANDATEAPPPEPA